MYRRPLPATNLRFLSAVMWDGRESPANLSIREGLLTQAKDATLGHAQAALAPTDAEAAAIVDFELGLSSAQAVDSAAGGLGTGGADGGPVPLSRQPFYLGMNDPLGQNSTGQAFDPNAFTLFDRWGLAGAVSATVATGGVHARRSARGQALFNTLSDRDCRASAA